MLSEQQLQALYNSLSLTEKVGQLLQVSGAEFTADGEVTGIGNSKYTPEELHAAGSVLGIYDGARMRQLQAEHMRHSRIPLLFMGDVTAGYASAQPMPLAQACSFSPELVRRLAQSASEAAASQGLHVTFSPMADISRDARWGRCAESYGEDVLLSRRMAAAAVTGYQEGADGRAVSAGNMYRLKISGLCSAQNYTYATSGFLDKTRLEEWISANSAFIPQRSLEDTGGQKTYDLVWVKAAEGDDVQAIAKVIRDAGFQTYSLNDMLESVKKQSNQIQGMLAAIGAVSMLVSAICIANTMMMSINERRKEIGVLKVLGSEMTDIMFMFMVEALLVGIAGGLFGMGLSFGMRELIPVLFSDMDVRSIIPVWLVVVGLGFSGIVALLSALAPAIGAMRISPLEAIRAE